MKTSSSIMEGIAFKLESSDYNGTEFREVSWSELRNSAVGDRFEVERSSNCGRDVCEESAKVVYKDDQGCALVFNSYRTSDDPNPREWDEEPMLQWFQFRK